MENASPVPNPEYALTGHEIKMVNAGTLHILEDDWIKRTGNAWVAQPPQYSSAEESKRRAVAGSSANDIIDTNEAQEPSLLVLSKANDYAYGVKHRVDAMYEEAYAANIFPSGPAEYFVDQKRQQEAAKSFRNRIVNFLGSLGTR